MFNFTRKTSVFKKKLEIFTTSFEKIYILLGTLFISTKLLFKITRSSGKGLNFVE